MIRINPVYAALERTVFDRISGLARDTGAINLGQGFPDTPPPAPLIEAAARALRERSNQYPPGAGLPQLRQAICEYYARRQGLALHPDRVTVTSGATEAIAAAVLALVSPGDEVILFQPAYDAYAPMVRRAGAVPVSVALAPPDFAYPLDALDRAITARTRALILNDPLNPAGTVASEAELAGLAHRCVAHDLVAICDEVWEDVRFDGRAHRSLTAFPGMAGRSVKIGSAGKIFGLTGWKIGWMAGDGAIGTALARAHQFLTFASAPALQWAVAEGLAMPDAMLDAQRAEWAAARARLRAGLEDAGFVVLPNAATWFLCVDLAASGIALDDATFADRAVREGGVATIPVSALYEGEARPTTIVRLCFTKPGDVLDEAVERLARFRTVLL
ncbi:aspartate/methionine/tyrosine aminotransferase [Novosphingobium chloroacetimidivorans]|uniref:Aspartate/methionine/tyrosine aminotransferase n=1 Tax=Novosphingobium chloroacetimidivorans TaxID=1428314 RepID=A0A7W7KDG7_9SPHN|nr:aminotransferase [Novosphingobium chloroacetimidivorans]MBB4860792.1 aspartate/methionine/tyrosine aminotransferase [Novosphingobium chloroacetimidivorans]